MLTVNSNGGGQVTPAYLLQYFDQKTRWNLTTQVATSSTQPGGDTATLINYEATVRIEQASGGVDNVITFLEGSPGPASKILNVKVSRINEFELGTRTVTYSDPSTGELIVSVKDDSN